MKDFWDNLFYGMKECGLSEKEFAEKAGNVVGKEKDREQ